VMPPTAAASDAYSSRFPVPYAELSKV